jgi:hypothetical protein
MKGIKGVSVPAGLPKAQRLALQRADAIRRRELHGKAVIKAALAEVRVEEVVKLEVKSGFGLALAKMPTTADIAAMPGGKPATVKGDMAQGRRDKIARECLKVGEARVVCRNAHGRGSTDEAGSWHTVEGRKYA